MQEGSTGMGIRHDCAPQGKVKTLEHTKWDSAQQ